MSSPFPRTARLFKRCRSASLDAAAALALVVGLPFASHAQTQAAPCDIYSNAGTPCVAAHSMTRALYAGYVGPLYQVARHSDGAVRDVGVLISDGYADTSAQDAFCFSAACTITRVYDQSPFHNDLSIEGRGSNGAPDIGAPANALPVTARGHKVYGLEISAGMGYRNDATIGVAKNGQPESMYMVTSGTHVNNRCCFDYGNVEVNNTDTGAADNGHMDAINFSTITGKPGASRGPGPWLRADLENGLFPPPSELAQHPSNIGSRTPYVTALLKNDGQKSFALKAGNAQNGSLETTYNGSLPAGYSPMHQEGAIVLGTGGDNSNGSIGSFFEGVMTAGVTSDEADNAVQANIVSVGYGGPTGLAGVLALDSEISLRSLSFCCGDLYLSHGGSGSNEVAVAAIPMTGATAASGDATWIIRRGLGYSSCVSLEARNWPGDYLRQSNFQLYRGPDDGTVQFAQDSTFCPVVGTDGRSIALQSVAFPTKLIRSYDHKGLLAAYGGANPWDTTVGYAEDASWIVSPPLAR